MLLRRCCNGTAPATGELCAVWFVRLGLRSSPSCASSEIVAWWCPRWILGFAARSRWCLWAFDCWEFWYFLYCKAISKHSVASIDVNAQVSLRQEEDKDRAKWAKVWVSLVWQFQQDSGVLRDLRGRDRAEATFLYLDKAAGTLRRHG